MNLVDKKINMKNIGIITLTLIIFNGLLAQKLPIMLFVNNNKPITIKPKMLEKQIAFLLQQGDTATATELKKTGKMTIHWFRNNADSLGIDYYLKINGRKFTKVIDLSKVKQQGNAKCLLYIQGVLKVKFAVFDVSTFHIPNLTSLSITYYGADKKLAYVEYCTKKNGRNVCNGITPREALNKVKYKKNSVHVATMMTFWDY